MPDIWPWPRPWPNLWPWLWSKCWQPVEPNTPCSEVDNDWAVKFYRVNCKSYFVHLFSTVWAHCTSASLTLKLEWLTSDVIRSISTLTLLPVALTHFLSRWTVSCLYSGLICFSIRSKYYNKQVIITFCKSLSTGEKRVTVGHSEATFNIAKLGAQNPETYSDCSALCSKDVQNATKVWLDYLDYDLTYMTWSCMVIQLVF